mmetsp:Transcript_33605/g.78119  ORF Transcript_33605/g.78119 Transcript_33605/m.78119 type:complete len:258 (+) Transcript_33605:2060-2833(+)
MHPQPVCKVLKLLTKLVCLSRPGRYIVPDREAPKKLFQDLGLIIRPLQEFKEPPLHEDQVLAIAACVVIHLQKSFADPQQIVTHVLQPEVLERLLGLTTVLDEKRVDCLLLQVLCFIFALGRLPSLLVAVRSRRLGRLVFLRSLWRCHPLRFHGLGGLGGLGRLFGCFDGVRLCICSSNFQYRPVPECDELPDTLQDCLCCRDDVVAFFTVLHQDIVNVVERSRELCRKDLRTLEQPGLVCSTLHRGHLLLQAMAQS